MPLFEFIETRSFTRSLGAYLDDEQYARLQNELNSRPNAGNVVPGSGGVRKLRWGVAGRGKRGGLRVVYYFESAVGQIWMLALYAKNVHANIPSHVLNELRKEFESAQND